MGFFGGNSGGHLDEGQFADFFLGKYVPKVVGSAKIPSLGTWGPLGARCAGTLRLVYSPAHCVAGPDGSILILDGSMGLDVPQSNASHVKGVIAKRPLSHDLGSLFQQFADTQTETLGPEESLRWEKRCYVSQPPPDATMVWPTPHP